MGDMTTQRYERIPTLTLGWRLKMALEGRLTVQEMADYLGVSRATLSRWMADKGAPPKRAYLAQWALRTEVPIDWLETGKGSLTGPSGPDGGEGGSLDKLTAAKRARANGRNGTGEPNRR